MAAPRRQKDPDVGGSAIAAAWEEVARRLRLEPFKFRFFQAAWLLERMQPDRAPLGGFAEPDQEAARFGSHPSLLFPASDIQALDWDQPQPRVRVNFMGMQGLSGVLPYSYTQLIEERSRTRDNTLRDFLDVFNHRLISLFYRAWKRYKFPVDGDRLRHALRAVVGLGTRGLEKRQSIEDETVVFYAGLIGLQPRSASALEHLLSDYFGVPVEAEQFVGAWYSLAPETTCRFRERDVVSDQLGLGAVVGDEVWDQQGRVRVRLGPLTRVQYEQFLPGREAFRRLRDLTRFFARDQIDFEAQLILRKQDVPGCQLNDESAIQLGWTTWMKTKPVYPRNAEDAVLDLRALP
jgi:type VI secretion system protein ImpH